MRGKRGEVGRSSTYRQASGSKRNRQSRRAAESDENDDYDVEHPTGLQEDFDLVPPEGCEGALTKRFVHLCTSTWFTRTHVIAMEKSRT